MLKVVYPFVALLMATGLAGCASDAGRAGESAALHYSATITRTQFGIPHVRAADFGGLGFGAAYARAEDNLCLMAETYVTFAGERSKYFGSNGLTLIGIRPGKNVDSDVFYKAVTDRDALRAAFQRRSADYQALFDGWVAGYNRFLEDHAATLPAPCAGQPWVRAITRDDALRSVNGFAILSSSAILAPQIANAAPPTAVAMAHADDLPDPRDVTAGWSLGSNGWAFGGDATDSGRGLVVGNPHFPWSGANRFYETQLTIPGRIDVAGAAILTLPFVGIGFNRDVAWTHTVDMAAHMTLFKLALDASDPSAYTVDGQRETMARREISVETQDGPPIVRTLYVSRYGPMVSVPGTEFAWTRQSAYAVADADNGNIRSGDTWLAIAEAHSVHDIRDALARHLGAPFLNTMAADRSGTALYADITAVPDVSSIQFAQCGSIRPRLPGHLQELYVLDGSRSQCAWGDAPETVERHLLPAAAMATLYRHDFVQNSNDSYKWSNPAAVQALGPIMGRDPGLGGLRTRAAIEEIGRVLQDGKFSIERGAQTMLANRDLAADLAMPGLLELCKKPSAPREACSALAGWDRTANLDSRGAMLFTLFWGKVGMRPDLWRTPPDPGDPVHTPRDLVVDGKAGDDLLAALTAAADALKAQGVAPDAPLGQVQFAERGSEHIPISGAQFGGVLNYVVAPPTTGGFGVVFGSSYIQAVGFDDQGPVAQAVLTYSQSADPTSPHFADQTREFSRRQLHRFPFTDAEIAADALGEPLTVRQ